MTDATSIQWADRSDRERLILSGPDRAKFLHNYCTNDVKRLKAGQGCEAFVTSLQGRTIAWITVHDRGDDLLIRADPGGLALALPHLAKYSIFDDVETRDVKAESEEVHFLGSEAESTLARWLPGGSMPEAGESSCALRRIMDQEVCLIRESPLGLAGITLIADRTWLGSFLETFAEEIRPEIGGLSPGAVEGLRIEAGTPRFGLDITTENLPQEIDRDARAISFVKGCYLGQETVARLDALGHVNKILRRVVVTEGGPPPAGTPLLVGGGAVGTVTSSGIVPWHGTSHAVAMVRVNPAPPGTVVSWDAGRGEVRELAPGRPLGGAPADRV